MVNHLLKSFLKTYYASSIAKSLLNETPNDSNNSCTKWLSQESKDTKLATREAKLNTEIENMIVVDYSILSNINEKGLSNNYLVEVKTVAGASTEKINKEIKILSEIELNKVMVPAGANKWTIQLTKFIQRNPGKV